MNNGFWDRKAVAPLVGALNTRWTPWMDGAHMTLRRLRWNHFINTCRECYVLIGLRMLEQRLLSDNFVRNRTSFYFQTTRRS